MINKIVEESLKNINKIVKKVPCVLELDITSAFQCIPNVYGLEKGGRDNKKRNKTA